MSPNDAYAATATFNPLFEIRAEEARLACSVSRPFNPLFEIQSLMNLTRILGGLGRFWKWLLTRAAFNPLFEILFVELHMPYVRFAGTFQSSFWDSSYKLSRPKRVAHVDAFQSSFWDSERLGVIERALIHSYFQSSFWDSRWKTAKLCPLMSSAFNPLFEIQRRWNPRGGVRGGVGFQSSFWDSCHVTSWFYFRAFFWLSILFLRFSKTLLQIAQANWRYSFNPLFEIRHAGGTGRSIH